MACLQEAFAEWIFTSTHDKIIVDDVVFSQTAEELKAATTSLVQRLDQMGGNNDGKISFAEFDRCDFVFKMMNSALTMLNSVLKMMNSTVISTGRLKRLRRSRREMRHGKSGKRKRVQRRSSERFRSIFDRFWTDFGADFIIVLF